MKKILIVSALSISGLTAKPYGGLKIGTEFLNPQSKIQANLRRHAGPQRDDISAPLSTKINSAMIGILFGNNFFINKDFDFNLEADVLVSLSKKQEKRGERLSYRHITVNGNVDLNRVFSIGLAPSVSYKMNDRLSVLFGTRLAANYFKATAYHARANGTYHADNFRSNSAYVMSVEPFIGGSVKMSDKVSTRFSVGYIFGASKKIINNYIGSPTLSQDASAGLSIKPKGVKLSCDFLYSF